MMKDFKQSEYEPEEVMQKIDIAQDLSINHAELAAKYIEHHIVNNGTLDYQVFPTTGRAAFAVVDDVNNHEDGWRSSGMGSGPVARMRRNGFIVYDINCYENSLPITLETAGVEKEELPEAYFIATFRYVGEDHPVLEYWKSED